MSDSKKIRRRQRCPKCGTLNVMKWGTRNGVQRYKCRECGALFSSHRKDVSISNRLPWFKKWVQGKMSVEDISTMSGYSTRQLHRWFDEYLDQSPTWTFKASQPIYLEIDGTYYSDNHCLIAYRASNLKRTIFYRFTTREDDDEIASDLMNIRSMGYQIAGITTDGGDDIIRAVKFVFPKVPRQRCVVHVQRECKSFLSRQPRSPEVKSLKGLIADLTNIKTKNDKLWWLKMYDKWVEENEEYACEKGTSPNSNQTYFLRNDLRRAYVHLKRAIPNLFTYLDDPDLPNTTNSIEAFWGHMKDVLGCHRGLSESRIDNFIKWYLFFQDEKKKK